MNKLIPFSKFSKKAQSWSVLSETTVVIDGKNNPIGFVFGRDSFISFLEHIDNAFHQKVKDQKQAFNNPAGKLIDLIEEKLPVNEKFVKDLEKTLKTTKKSDWISMEELTRSLNV